MRRTLCGLLITGITATSPAVLDGTVTVATGDTGTDTFPALSFDGASQWLLCTVVQTGFSDTSGLYGARIGPGGAASPQFRVADNDLLFNRFPAVHHSPSGGFHLVVFSRPADLSGWRVAESAGGGTGGSELIGDRFDITSTGTSMREHDPALAYNPEDNEFLCVYLRGDVFDAGAVHGVRLSGSTGQPLAPPFLISADIEGQGRPRVAYSPADDAYLVVWRDAGPAAVGRRIGRTGSLDTAIFSLGLQGNPTVAYAPDRDEFLVATSFGSTITHRRVLGTNPTSGSQFASDVQTYNSSDGFDPEVTYVAGEGAWLMVFDGAADPWPVRAAWIDELGALNDLPLGMTFAQDPVLASHAGDVNSARVAWRTGEVQTLTLSQSIPLGRSAGTTTDIDLLRMPTIAALWNFLLLRPEDGLSGSLFLYSDFYSTLEASATASPAPGAPALIAVDRESGTVSSPHVTVSLSSGFLPFPPTNQFTMERAVAGLFDILTPPASREDVASDVDSASLQAFGLNCEGAGDFVVTVIPRDSSLRLGAAVFQSTPSDRYLGLSDALVHSPPTSPSPGASLPFSTAAADILGLAIYSVQGSGSYDIVFRDPNECTSAEIVAYLLGLIPAPPGAEINGVPPVDIGDAVAAVNEGR